MDKKINNDSCKLEIIGWCANTLVMLLIAVMTSIIPLLLNNGSAIFYVSLPFYITVVILFACVMYFQYWGILIGVISFGICALFQNLPLKIMLVNCAANILQIFMILSAYKWLKKINTPNKNKYATGTFYLSQYNFSLLLTFILYILFYIFNPNNLRTTFYIFAIAAFLLTLIKIIINKDIHLFLFTIGIAFFPSFLCSMISSYCSGVPTELRTDYVCLWTLSNYILLQTCGYLLYQIFFSRKPFRFHNGDILDIHVNSIIYYIAILSWNILILYLLYSEVLCRNIYIYFFPWALGNIFFGFNFLFSFQNDAEKVENKFAWYENRIIVIKKNTSGIITIISFLLPLSVSFIGNIPNDIIVLFIANIFCACFSVSLIWVPSSNIKFIALLKTLKTVFYLYSITLLLISVMMIMANNSVT